MNLGLRNHLAPFFAPLRLCGKIFLAPRSTNDYATHVPVLIGLARMREIRSVLELGCGHYSTLTFLNRMAFPDLERLHSIENDTAWATALRDAVNHDDRWTLRLVNGSISDNLADLDLESFDLVLIDDSQTSEQRVATIRTVAAREPQHPWIAIHDFEFADYQQAASAFKHRFRFRAYNPETGLLWNNANGPANPKSLARLLKQNTKTLQPDDVEGWTRVIS